MVSVRSYAYLSQKLCYGGRISGTGSTAYYRAVCFFPVLRKVQSSNKRAHAVPEKDKGHSGELSPYESGHGMKVFNEVFRRVCIAEFIGIGSGHTVTEVIVPAEGYPLRAEISGVLFVPSDIFAHTVTELNDRAGILRGVAVIGNPVPTVRGREKALLKSHGIHNHCPFDDDFKHSLCGC